MTTFAARAAGHDTDHAGRVAGELALRLLRRRRTTDVDHPVRPCCVADLGQRLEPAVRAGAPLHMVLPAFPAKSPSPRKVLGALPDLAEQLSLDHLQRLCDDLADVHEPGAELLICSDGRVFADILELGDDTVTAYLAALRRMIARSGCRSLSVFDLDDVAAVAGHERLRAWVDANYAPTVDEIVELVRTDADTTRMYNGIHRFLVEDLAGVRPQWSRSRLRRECRGRTYDVIRRSQAWSAVVAERFPHSLRLSIHPQRPHAAKLGVRLLDTTSDVWINPWHGTAVRRGDSWTLMYRREAEALGARPAAGGDHYALVSGAAERRAG